MREMSPELEKFIGSNFKGRSLEQAERLRQAREMTAGLACIFMLEDKVALAKQYARLFVEARAICDEEGVG